MASIRRATENRLRRFCGRRKFIRGTACSDCQTPAAYLQSRPGKGERRSPAGPVIDAIIVRLIVALATVAFAMANLCQVKALRLEMEDTAARSSTLL